MFSLLPNQPRRLKILPTNCNWIWNAVRNHDYYKWFHLFHQLQPENSSSQNRQRLPCGIFPFCILANSTLFSNTHRPFPCAWTFSMVGQVLLPLSSLLLLRITDNKDWDKRKRLGQVKNKETLLMNEQDNQKWLFFFYCRIQLHLHFTKLYWSKPQFHKGLPLPKRQKKKKKIMGHADYKW